jgi:putative hemolysin
MNKKYYPQNPYHLLFVVFILSISGCASTQPKSTPLTEQMIQSNKGDFEGLWNAWIKPQLNSKSEILVEDYDEKLATEDAIAAEFKRFCAAMGGITASNDQKYGRSSICTSTNGEYLGGFNITRYTSGIGVVVNSKELKKKKAEEMAIAEETERKRKYQRLALDYLSISELSGLINQFNNNDPDNLIPKAKERLASLKAAESTRVSALLAERKKQQAIEEAAIQARKERKNIGDQICMNTQGTVEQDTGYIVLGQRQYRSITGNTRIVGFVESIAGKKIQLRISGINFTGNDGSTKSLDSFSNFNGGSTLKINSVIWDSIYSWDGC